MTTRSSLLIIVFSILVVGCGGGGGGGNGSGSRVGLRVLNGAIDAPPVGLYSSLAETGPLSLSRFGLASERVRLPDGEQVLILAKGARITEPLLSMPFPAERPAKQTLLVYGNRSNLGLRYSLISDDSIEPEGEAGLLRVVHALNGAAAVDVTVEGAGVFNVPFGSASEYIELSAGSSRITIRRSADQAVVFSGFRTIPAGERRSVMITGQVDYFVSAVDSID